MSLTGRDTVDKALVLRYDELAFWKGADHMPKDKESYVKLDVEFLPIGPDNLVTSGLGDDELPIIG